MVIRRVEPMCLVAITAAAVLLVLPRAGAAQSAQGAQSAQAAPSPPSAAPQAPRLPAPAASAAQQPAPPAPPSSSTGFGTANLPFAEMNFGFAAPMIRGPQLAHIWGDPTSGPHGFLVRLPARWESNFHIHPHTYHAIVLQGVAVNNYWGQTKEVPLSRGGYFATLAGVNHNTRCLSQEECIFYVQMDGPFGALPPFTPPGQRPLPAQPADIR